MSGGGEQTGPWVDLAYRRGCDRHSVPRSGEGAASGDVRFSTKLLGRQGVLMMKLLADVQRLMMPFAGEAQCLGVHRGP